MKATRTSAALSLIHILEQTGLHPGVILDTMTSPAGVGIEAICTMKKHGVSGAVMDSVEQAVKKANSLG